MRCPRLEEASIKTHQLASKSTYFHSLPQFDQKYNSKMAKKSKLIIGIIQINLALTYFTTFVTFRKTAAAAEAREALPKIKFNSTRGFIRFRDISYF